MKSRKQVNAHTWRTHFSLGTGLLFLSILAFVAQSYPAGTLIFAIGLYFLFQGAHLKKKKRASFSQWMSVRAIQSLVLIGLGVVLMTALPASWFGFSFIVTLIGFGMFLSIKRTYIAHPLTQVKKKPAGKRNSSRVRAQVIR